MNANPLSQLAEGLGNEYFQALINPVNTEAVLTFARKLAENCSITVGGRQYDLLTFHQGRERGVKGRVMFTRAKNMLAKAEKEDGFRFLENQEDIPLSLRGKVSLVFIDWRHVENPSLVAVLYWDGDSWVRQWSWLEMEFMPSGRVVRAH